jgi:putative oxidoreductase
MLDRLQDTTVASSALGLGVIRVGFGVTLALAHGFGKLRDLGEFTGKVVAKGIWLAEVMAPAAVLSEVLGGLLLALGLFARPAAACVAVTMLVAAFVVHAGDPFGRRELALAYACVAIGVLLAGPGRYSLDAWWRSRRR